MEDRHRAQIAAAVGHNFISCIPLRLIHRSQCPVVFQWVFLLLQSELGFDRYVEHADAASAVAQPSLATHLRATPN